MTSAATVLGPNRGKTMGVGAGAALVLVVDDYQDCREMYAAYLSLAGFRVLKARDAIEAIEIARRHLPDLVLMDLSLPGMDGFEATSRLKRDTLTRNVPVVALTAQSQHSENDLRAIGFEGLIVKPCLPDELADRVLGILRLHARQAC